MEQLVQCPVCTLYLHTGMSLESHLDTHPKDQVIKALCSLSVNGNFSSRSHTPHSERSYRSRSRTPADDTGSKWNGSQRSIDNEHYWRRTPNRSNKTPSLVSMSRICTPTPEIRLSDTNFDNNMVNNCTQCSIPYMPRNDKIQQTNMQSPINKFGQHYVYYAEHQDDKEIKYSRSEDFPNHSLNSVFTYNMHSVTPTSEIKSPTSMSATPRKGSDTVKIAPKANNMMIKPNISGVQYIAPGVKPMHVMLPTVPAIVQKNVQNNVIMTSSIPPMPMLEPKPVFHSVSTSNFGHITSDSMTPSATVLTQNSQISYREMMHNIDGKPYITSMPKVTNTHDNITNTCHSSSLYQNVMVVDQYGNTSCMYATAPQPLMPKHCNTTYNETLTPTSTINKTLTNFNDATKTLVIEVCPMIPPQTNISESTTGNKFIDKNEVPSSNKGLKILSNIKVEVPVQHHKNMINTVMDLTGSSGNDYPECSLSPDKILPDLEENNSRISEDCTQPSTSSSDSVLSNTFSVIKNIGNPPSTYKDVSSKSNTVDNKIETEFSDSCPVPDLICNEKTSISPCDFSDNCDNSDDHSSTSTNKQASHSFCDNTEMKINKRPLSPQITYKFNPLPLNNIYLKKNKKILHIKKSKLSIPDNGLQDKVEPEPSTSNTFEKFHKQSLLMEEKSDTEHEDLKSDEINEYHSKLENQNQEHPGFTVTNIDLVQVKVESTTVEDKDFNSQTLESLRPIGTIDYGEEFNNGSDRRELLDLEVVTRAERYQSVSYFGDDAYTDYFPSETVASTESVCQTSNSWSQPTQNETEFVLPNFIHESYKIAESDYAEMESHAEAADSKTDVLSETTETPLNICTDERMPSRGELSGQESNEDLDSPWTRMYEVETGPPVTYDLIARESWISDGSDVETDYKREPSSNCTLKLKKAQKYLTDIPSTPDVIKKEEKTDICSGGEIIPIEPKKESLAATILQVYDSIPVAKPKVEGGAFINSMTKRRRRKNYLCGTCKVDQLTEAAFRDHLKIHPLECLTCGKCFYRRANLQLHLNMHLGIKNFKCEACEKRFATRQKLSEHYNIHTGRTPFKCTHCDKTFRRYSNMLQHRDRKHLLKKPKVRDYVCHCGLVYHSLAKLRWHKETHDEKPKSCLYCSDKFMHSASLTRHVRRTHNKFYVSQKSKNKSENVPCPVCKQVYLRENLRAHLTTHSGKRPYLCVICNKSFTTKWNLKLHRWTHMSRSTKPYKCNLCKGAFIRHSEYVSHMNSHKSFRPYTCNYCGCQFIRKYNCQRHVREHEKDKKYVCKVPDCGKTFHRSYYLSEHMKVHSGIRPFACNICGKTSSNKSNHNKHVKIHHAREPIATEA